MESESRHHWENVYTRRSRMSCLSGWNLPILLLLSGAAEPERYEAHPYWKTRKISVSRQRSCTFVRVCSRGFCRVYGGATAVRSKSALIN